MNSDRFGGFLAGPLQALPILGEDLYLRMQAINLSVVDVFLRDLENDLLAEYIEQERTPIPDAIFVSSLTQLWVFGLYELLRTWRQQTRDALEFANGVLSRAASDRKAYVAQKKTEIGSGNPFPEGGTSWRWAVYERIAAAPKDESYKIQTAVDRAQLLFKRLEALRVHLAKHEMPKRTGSEAMAPGYGRIDMTDGSIKYQVLLRDNEVDMLSRRALADAVEHIDDDPGDVFLPNDVRQLTRGMPEVHYGTKQVKVTLRDGSTYSRVLIAWDRQVIHVSEHWDIPFNASEIIHVEPCTVGRDHES